MILYWRIRHDDVYLTGWDRFGQPEFGTKDEARKYGTRRAARSAQSSLRSFVGAPLPVVVRVVPSPSEEPKR